VPRETTYGSDSGNNVIHSAVANRPLQYPGKVNGHIYIYMGALCYKPEGHGFDTR
jgi:hypothetical protein